MRCYLPNTVKLLLLKTLIYDDRSDFLHKQVKNCFQWSASSSLDLCNHSTHKMFTYCPAKKIWLAASLTKTVETGPGKVALNGDQSCDPVSNDVAYTDTPFMERLPTAIQFD